MQREERDVASMVPVVRRRFTSYAPSGPSRVWDPDPPRRSQRPCLLSVPPVPQRVRLAAGVAVPQAHFPVPPTIPSTPLPHARPYPILSSRQSATTSASARHRGSPHHHAGERRARSAWLVVTGAQKHFALAHQSTEFVTEVAPQLHAELSPRTLRVSVPMAHKL